MFISNSAKDKKLKTNILALAKEAAEAKKKDSSAINATAGSLKDENDGLHEFLCVKQVLATLNVNEKFAYANSDGSPEFTRAILYSLFGNFLESIKEKCYLECLPTPGGSGALNLAFTNYVERGETVLLPNHMWENYLNYGTEMGFKSLLYTLFDDGDNFDINGLRKKIDSIKENQKRILITINDPCENPTGFCMKDEDYDNLINISKANPNNDFIYLVDVAYFDFYNVNPDIIRKRFSKFKDIPENAMALFVFSGSKSFGLYGLRIGALVGLTRDKKEIEAFKDANNFSCRAKWSSATTLGMNIIQKLVLHDEYRFEYEEEVKSVCAMLEERSLAFMKSAKEVGLKTLPYERGFFICVPVDNPEKILKELHNDKVYLVNTKTCLRIALCAISKDEASRLPSIIKKRLA